MTDLEDLWNSLPAGEPPTGRILAQGRAGSRHRTWRAVRRPILATGVVAALGAAFVAGTLVPDGTDGPVATRTPPPAAISPVAFKADLAPADSCDALLSTYIHRSLGQVTSWGWGRPYLMFGAYNDRLLTPLAVSKTPLNARAPQAYDSLSTQRVTASGTGTNVQENAVDEPDTVKTDGTILVRLRNRWLFVYDVTGPTVKLLSSLYLPDLDNGEILLSGDTVVAIGTNATSPSASAGGLRGSRVETVSLSDPSDPQLVGNVTYGAAVTSARQHGDTIRMVLSAGLPDLGFVQPHKGLSSKRALRRNRAIVKHSTLAQWLPHYNAGSGRQDLLDCQNVAVPPAEVGLDTVAVVTFSATSPTTPQAFGLAGATSIAYESADHLYLVSSPFLQRTCFDCLVPLVSIGGTSYLFKFDLTDDQAVHVASGEVEGTIRDRWSMDEAGGQLRVLVGPSSETGNFSSIVTFEQRGEKLVETGRLDHLGPRQQVKSVRWQDDLAIVVTYRQIDPLYVVDLRGKPTLISKLKVSGYSSYLHPLGTRRLIGVGFGRGKHGWGAQMGLFAVHDLSKVHRLDVTHYGRGTSPVAASDPRAFTWLPEHRTVLTVIRYGSSVGYLSIQHLEHGRLHNRMVKVEYGSDIDQVRTLGMPDGRVILVTGEQVRFLSL